MNNSSYRKTIFILCLAHTVLITGCSKNESAIESSIVETIESTEERSEEYLNESDSDDFYNDSTRYEALDGKTKAEYREYLKDWFTPYYVTFDADKVKEDLEAIDDKESLGEYLYDNFDWIDRPDDGDNQPSHEEEVMFIICDSGYVVTPHAYWSPEDKENWYARHPEYDVERTPETGSIDEEIWNNFSLEEAREHVYKILKMCVDKKNNLEDEYLRNVDVKKECKRIIEDCLKSDEAQKAEQEALELSKSLQEEVDAIYEKQKAEKQAAIDAYFTSDNKRYASLDDMTKAEYRQWWLDNRALEYVSFDGESLLEQMEHIDNKEELGELLYDNILYSDNIMTSFTHQRDIELLIINSGYVYLPEAGFAKSDAEFYELLKEYDKTYIPENGFIEMEDWNNFSLDEAKEHVYRIVEHNYRAYNEKNLYKYAQDDEKIVKIINSRLKREQE